MTLSGWSESERDAGHDELQAEVYRFLKRAEPATTKIAARGGAPDRVFRRASIEVEYPFVRENRVIGFADVCEVWHEEKTDRLTVGGVLYKVFEIKPRIYSVGAIIRQCKATRQLMLSVGNYHNSGWSGPALCRVTAVVPHDDPKVALLKEMFENDGYVWAWGGIGQP